MGCVMRDSKGIVLGSSAEFLENVLSSLDAEGLASYSSCFEMGEFLQHRKVCVRDRLC